MVVPNVVATSANISTILHQLIAVIFTPMRVYMFYDRFYADLANDLMQQQSNVQFAWHLIDCPNVMHYEFPATGDLMIYAIDTNNEQLLRNADTLNSIYSYTFHNPLNFIIIICTSMLSFTSLTDNLGHIRFPDMAIIMDVSSGAVPIGIWHDADELLQVNKTISISECLRQPKRYVTGLQQTMPRFIESMKFWIDTSLTEEFVVSDGVFKVCGHLSSFIHLLAGRISHPKHRIVVRIQLYETLEKEALVLVKKASNSLLFHNVNLIFKDNNEIIGGE